MLNAARPVFLCENLRTPIGRYGGPLSSVWADDLAALPIERLIEMALGLDRTAIEEVFLGCANQAGEDNRNVARMAALLAALPVTVPGVTLNRLRGSGIDAVGTAARIAMTAARELSRRKGGYALVTMCIGVGQGIAAILERA